MKNYSEKYDSYYDDETDEWLEGTCSDPTCEYCAERPEKPSMAQHQYNIYIKDND